MDTGHTGIQKYSIFYARRIIKKEAAPFGAASLVNREY
jgi:hypothetical protein